MRTWLHRVNSLKRYFHDLRESAAFRNSRLNFLERNLRRARLFSRPIVLQIEFTNACNLSCASCGHSYWDSSVNRPRLITLDLLKRIQPLYETCSEILIGGYGEPTLHPDLKSLMAWLKRDVFKKISLISHGLKIPEVLQDLEGLNTLILSMDGIGKIYESHRGVSFQKLVDSLDFFLANKDPKTRLEVNMVWNQRTHEGLKEMVDFLESYEVKVLHLLPEKIYSPKRLGESLFHPQNLHELKMELQRIQKSTKILLDYPDFLAASVPCKQPLETIFILSNGEVLACCSAIFHGNDYRFSLGDLNALEDDFTEFWNQDKLIKFREAFYDSDVDYPSPCNTCAFRLVRHEHLQRFL